MVYFLLLFFVCYHGQWSSTILVSWLLRVSCQTSSLCYQSVVLQFCHIPSTILNITVFTSWWFFCFFILQMWLYDFLFLYFITLTTVLPGMSIVFLLCLVHSVSMYHIVESCPDKTEWRLILATLCGWRRCFVADQLWLMKRIWEEAVSKSRLCIVEVKRQDVSTSIVVLVLSSLLLHKVLIAFLLTDGLT